MQLIEYNLPEWALLDAHSHLGNLLEYRTVILHTKSASVIEIIDRDHDGFIPSEGFLGYNFKYESEAGSERFSAALHYCATLDRIADRELIRETILKPCAMWYCEYCKWEDDNIINDHFNE